MESTQAVVELKGRQNYLEIHLDGQADFELLKQMMIDKLEAGGHFFIGSQYVQVIGVLDDEKKEHLRDILEKQFSFEKIFFQEKVIQFKPTRKIESKPKKIEQVPSVDLGLGALSCQEGASIFINNTIRNGQRIAYDGHIVVKGDVNRGGELVATGNIIVMGVLRGRAHAGSAGDTRACVCALELIPQQLRIAQILAIPPENDEAATVPEMASVLQDSIIIAPLMKTKRRKKSFFGR